MVTRKIKKFLKELKLLYLTYSSIILGVAILNLIYVLVSHQINPDLIITTNTYGERLLEIVIVGLAVPGGLTVVYKTVTKYVQELYDEA